MNGNERVHDLGCGLLAKTERPKAPTLPRGRGLRALSLPLSSRTLEREPPALKARKDSRPKKRRLPIGQGGTRGGLFLQEQVVHWSSLRPEGWDWSRLSEGALRAEAGRRRAWPALGPAPGVQDSGGRAAVSTWDSVFGAAACDC